MDKRTYWIIVAIVAALTGAILYFIVKNLPAGLVGGIVGGCISAWIMKGYIKKAVSEAVQEAVNPSKPMGQDPEKILSGLVDLNTLIRTEGFDLEIITISESVIDQLIDVIPDMVERYGGEELTWETMRMAEKHLPSLIGNFGSLSPADRISQKAKLLSSLSAMEAELNEIGQLVRDHQLNEFERKAATVRMKYGASSIA